MVHLIQATRRLGATDLEVGRIGISSSYGADEKVFAAALERGCTYFTWGTFIRGRSGPFRTFFRQLCADGRRDEVVLGLLSYSHSALLGEHFLKSALKQLGTDYLDALILGYHPKRPPQRVLDWALAAKRRGLVRAVGMTTHNRAAVIPLVREGLLDFFHIRYNAEHRGAESDIFVHLPELRPGIVSFTATSWGRLLDPRKMAADTPVPSAGDCYRFVLAREEVDVCMMGVRNLQMFEANMAALEKGPMSAAELEWMRTVGDRLHR